MINSLLKKLVIYTEGNFITQCFTGKNSSEFKNTKEELADVSQGTVIAAVDMNVPGTTDFVHLVEAAPIMYQQIENYAQVFTFMLDMIDEGTMTFATQAHTFAMQEHLNELIKSASLTMATAEQGRHEVAEKLNREKAQQTH